jgi:hypothetical protein
LIGRDWNEFGPFGSAKKRRPNFNAFDPPIDASGFGLGFCTALVTLSEAAAVFEKRLQGGSVPRF